MLGKHTRKPQRVLTGRERLLRHVQRQIKLAKREIVARHARDHGGENRMLAPSRREQAGARGLGLAAVFSPKIQIPHDRQIDLPGVCLIRWKCAGYLRIAFAECFRSRAHCRKLVGARNSNLRLRLKHAACGYSKVIVLLDGRSDQLLQYGILEYVPPFFIAQCFGCGHRRLTLATVGAGCFDRGSLVIRTDQAPREQQTEYQANATSHFMCSSQDQRPRREPYPCAWRLRASPRRRKSRG